MGKYINEYKFSLTGGSLLLDEMILVNQWLIENNATIDQFQLENLGKDRIKTSKREFAEIKLRIGQLSSEERKLLSGGTYDIQKLIAYISCVRSYRILREFIDEVILDKLSIFDHNLTDYDYQKFFNNKADQNPRIEKLADSTKDKVKQVTFRILVQAGIIDDIKTKTIIKPILDYPLQSILREDDLKYLLQ